MSWLRGIRLLRKRKVNHDYPTSEEEIYDVDNIRALEYRLLDRETYLDHAGTTLFPMSVLDAFVKDITTKLYGNPHSESTSSRLSTLKIDEVRQRALQFFNANPVEFDLVFVQNATAAIKLVADILQSLSEGDGGFWYGYHGDAHTSLIGIREVARAGYACFDRDEDVENWIKTGVIGKCEEKIAERGSPMCLFAYPGQSNMTGRRLPLSWPGHLKRSTLGPHANVYTLLDAAALASTGELDLSNAKEAPDFIALSFYKIFGFPDLGALLVRRELGPMLRRRRYFGGGTVEMVVHGVQWHSLHAESPHAHLEDGTLPFHNIIALGHAMTAHERLYGSQKMVSRHTARLAKYLYDGMGSLRHADGTPLCVIYKEPEATYGVASSTGPTIAFNLRYADGTWVRLDDLETLANNDSIHLRTGGVCNPGGIAKALDLAPWEFLQNYVAGTRCGHGPVVLGGKPSGIARVSLGAMSCTKDVDAFIQFLRSHFLDMRPGFESQMQWTAGMGLTVTRLMIYPLEGARAWRVPGDLSWPIEGAGLRWDKMWFLMGLDTGEILTRAVAPRLLLLSSEVNIDSGVLRVTPHRSLNMASATDSHVCLPLEERAAGEMRQPACNCCVGGSLQISPRSVKRAKITVSATVCTSDHVVAFFSSVLGMKCTVARTASLMPMDDLISPPHLSKLDGVIIAGDASPPSTPPAPRSAVSVTSDLGSNTDSERRDTASPESGTLQPSEEASAERIQANVILDRHRDRRNLAQEHDWVFLSIGGRYIGPNTDQESSYHLARVTTTANTGKESRPHDSEPGKCYRLLRGSAENDTSWDLKAGRNLVLQAHQ